MTDENIATVHTPSAHFSILPCYAPAFTEMTIPVEIIKRAAVKITAAVITVSADERVSSTSPVVSSPMDEESTPRSFNKIILAVN